MGCDARIKFKTIDGKEIQSQEWPCLPKNYDIRSHPPDEDGATHTVDLNGLRYYAEGYERGPWPVIAHILMVLFASDGVEKVWYNGDYDEKDRECTVGDVLRISKIYMEQGTRPYDGRPLRQIAGESFGVRDD